MDFLRRAGVIALIALIIYTVIKDPAGGSHAVHAITTFFGQAASALSTFLNGI